MQVIYVAGERSRPVLQRRKNLLKMKEKRRAKSSKMVDHLSKKPVRREKRRKTEG